MWPKTAQNKIGQFGINKTVDWLHFAIESWTCKKRRITKGQLNSELIYAAIVFPKMQTKNYKDFFPAKQTDHSQNKLPTLTKKSPKKSPVIVCLFGWAEILVIFGLHFGRNDDLINSFWVWLTFRVLTIISLLL